MTGVIAGGIFNHYDARPSELAGFGDPHLHSHCVIFNTVYDGENFRALDARPIMRKDVILTFGQAYQKAVSEGLHSHKFDQILVRGPEGMIFPAIPAIPKPVISAFSSRSDDISQYSMTMSVSRQTATLSTRRPKISNIVEQLSIWKEMFGLFNFDLRQYRHYVQQTKKTRKAPTPDFLSGDLLNRLRGRKVRLTEVLRETILEQMRNVQMSLPELMARLIASRYFMRVTNRIATLQLTDHAIAYLDSMIALRNAVHRLKTENRRDAPKINRNSLLNIKSILNESNSALPAPPTSTSDRQQENQSVHRPTDTHISASGAGALQSQKGKDERLTEAAPRLIQRI